MAAKRKVIITVLVFLALAIAAMLLVRDEQQFRRATHNGKTVKEWAGELYQNYDPRKTNAPSAAFIAMGSNAVYYLASVLVRTAGGPLARVSAALLRTAAFPARAAQAHCGALAVARKQIQALLGAEFDHEIVYTSGGTEANMLALAPAIDGTARDKLLVSAIEHPSVLAGGRFPAAAVERLPVTAGGEIDLAALERDAVHPAVRPQQPAPGAALAPEHCEPEHVVHAAAVDAGRR